VCSERTLLGALPSCAFWTGLFFAVGMQTAYCDADSLNRAYADRYLQLAVEQQKLYRIPASITLAQGILESAAGTSPLAVRGNNHFGIKCGAGWSGDTVLVDDDIKGECFRRYESADSSFADRVVFLSKARYRFLFDSLEVTDYKGWAFGLKRAGYATDTAYPARLIGLIERLALNRYDLTVLAQDTGATSVKQAEYRSGIASEPSKWDVVTVVKPGTDTSRWREALVSGWIYRTKAGESPLEVAAKTGIPLKLLQVYNNLDRNLMQFNEGQILVLNRYRFKKFLAEQGGQGKGL